jgi:hypothetical protein
MLPAGAAMFAAGGGDTAKLLPAQATWPVSAVNDAGSAAAPALWVNVLGLDFGSLGDVATMDTFE